MRFVKVSIFGALLTVVSMLCGCGDGCHKEHWGPWLETVFSGEDAILFQRSSGWNQYCNTVIASGSEDEYSKYEYFLALSWEDSVRNVTEPYEEWRAKSKNPTIYGTRAFPQMMANDYAVAIRDNGEAFQTWLWRWDGQIVEIGGKWGEEWKSGKTGAFHNRLFIDKSYVDRDVLYLSFSGGHSRAEGWAPVFYAQNLRTGKASTLDVAFDVDMKNNIKASERKLPIFKCKLNGDSIKYIVPVYGAGLWGPIWGYVAVNDNGTDIYGAYFSHEGETPGLGAEIGNPKFQEQFNGKSLYPDSTFKSISVMKAGQKPTDGSEYVDAISGGTITSRGVQAMLKDCMTPYDAFFKKLQSETK